MIKQLFMAKQLMLPPQLHLRNQGSAYVGTI